MLELRRRGLCRGDPAKSQPKIIGSVDSGGIHNRVVDIPARKVLKAFLLPDCQSDLLRHLAGVRHGKRSQDRAQVPNRCKLLGSPRQCTDIGSGAPAVNVFVQVSPDPDPMAPVSRLRLPSVVGSSLPILPRSYYIRRRRLACREDQ
jgi:hypothetical protein